MKKTEVTSLKVQDYSTGNRTANYNFEENPNFKVKEEKAREQRNILAELETKPVVPRRQRRVYDRPRYDTDITE